ncbi:retrotransposon-derived protein peg10 isoform 1, partial [Diplodia corticola]
VAVEVLRTERRNKVIKTEKKKRKSTEKKLEKANTSKEDYRALAVSLQDQINKLELEIRELAQQLHEGKENKKRLVKKYDEFHAKVKIAAKRAVEQHDKDETLIRQLKRDAKGRAKHHNNDPKLQRFLGNDLPNDQSSDSDSKNLPANRRRRERAETPLSNITSQNGSHAKRPPKTNTFNGKDRSRYPEWYKKLLINIKSYEAWFRGDNNKKIDYLLTSIEGQVHESLRPTFGVTAREKRQSRGNNEKFYEFYTKFITPIQQLDPDKIEKCERLRESLSKRYLSKISTGRPINNFPELYRVLWELDNKFQTYDIMFKSDITKSGGRRNSPTSTSSTNPKPRNSYKGGELGKSSKPLDKITDSELRTYRNALPKGAKVNNKYRREGEVGGRNVNYLADTGASAYAFVDPRLVKNLGLETLTIKKPRPLFLADGTVTNEMLTHQALVTFNLQGHTKEMLAYVINLAKGIDLILGMPWFELHNPEIDFSTRSLTFNSRYYYAKCLTGKAVRISGPNPKKKKETSPIKQRREEGKEDIDWLGANDFLTEVQKEGTCV